MTPVSRLLNCISTTDLENNKVICDILDYFNQKGFDFNRVFEHRPARHASIITQEANYIYDCIVGYPIRNKQKPILTTVQDSKLTVLKKLVELGCDVKTNSISFDYLVTPSTKFSISIFLKN